MKKLLPLAPGCDLAFPISPAHRARSLPRRRIAATLATALIALTGCGGGGGGSATSGGGSSSPFVLAATTYLGGSDIDSVRDVFVDSQGYVYVVGGTASIDFPATTGAYDTTFNGNNDVYVAKFMPGGDALVFATYLGGPNYDRAYAIEVDAQGFVYVAGRAGAGFPTTPGVVQPNFGGDVSPSSRYGTQDGFVAKLDPDGSTLLWSTYFGNDDSSICRDLALDSTGNCYVVGAPDRPHWAVTGGAFDTTLGGSGDGLVAAIAADGATLLWGSYFGGSGSDGGTPSVRVAPDDTVWVLGTSQSDDFPVTGGAYQAQRAGALDMVLLHIAADGSALIGSTYFGGSGVEYSETHGLWIEPGGSAVVAATSGSTDLPFVPASIPPPFQPTYGGSGGSGSGAGTDYPYDGFIARFNADATALLAFTYLGGTRGEGLEGVAVDAAGRVCCAGATYSADFPATGDAFQRRRDGGADQLFAVLSNDLTTLEYATYCGGRDDDLGRAFALASDGSLVSAGSADSTDYPTTPGVFQRNFGGLPQDACWFKVMR